MEMPPPRAPQVVEPWMLFAGMACGAGMVAAGLGLGRRRVWYYFALAVLAVNIVLTVTDQFGAFDLATLLLDLILLGLLVITRAQYLAAQ